MSGFPPDRYTPYGYLDLAGHTRNLNPKGVLRSTGIGFGWHFPALATSYGGRQENYRCALQVGHDGAWAIGDFDEVHSPYHSKDSVEFAARSGSAEFSAEFFTDGDDTLCARLSRDGLTVRVDYQRLIGASGGWGESGLVGRVSGDSLILQGFEDGEAFALRCTSMGPPRINGERGPVTVLAGRGEQATLRAEVPVRAGRVVLARGRTAREAVHRADRGWERFEEARAEIRARDDRFWAAAPRLSGDWPEHWRRGLVYDLETLRMMVKAPTGVYEHTWDAMQIQAPRVVLGEAAIDALLLGYADPPAAQDMLYGVFADAAEPNVPCSREDGSYNMVSATGEACGTGPQWGFPFLVVQRLFALRPDRDWLRRMYVPLRDYLGWWLECRRDENGWLVHACSWESGQDLSPRFGDQPLGGGHPTWSTRPVDLQAAAAHATTVMAWIARELHYRDDAATWQILAQEFTDRTQRMWTGQRYADQFEGRSTTMDDVMLLTPVALGVAGPAESAALIKTIEDTDPDELVWPMFVWTAVEAAGRAGCDRAAARIAAAIIDRAYRYWDSRDYTGEGTLPGITCEYWPLSGRCGGEGYGWGAFGVHLVLDTLLGLRFDTDSVTVRPNLPDSLRVPGRRYTLEMCARGIPVRIDVAVSTDGYGITVNGSEQRVNADSAAIWTLP